MGWRFKKPKRSSFFMHCGQCAHWSYLRQVGVAVEGKCSAIEPPTTEDAYGVPCGLFKLKETR